LSFNGLIADEKAAPIRFFKTNKIVNYWQSGVGNKTVNYGEVAGARICAEEEGFIQQSQTWQDCEVGQSRHLALLRYNRRAVA